MAELLLYTNGITSHDRALLGTYLNYRYRLLTNAPNAPSNIVAQAVSSQQVMLTWLGMDTNHAVNYRVERRTGRSGPNLTVTMVTDATSYFDTNITAGTTYYYRVKAVNYWTESSAVETSVLTPASTTALPLANLKLWLRADAGVVRQSATGTVPMWLDQVSTNDATLVNSENTSALKTNQPAYVPQDTHGHPALAFNVGNADGNGTNDYLAFFGTPLFASNPESEVYLVHRAAITNSNTQGFWDMGNGQGNDKTRYADQLNQVVDNFGCNQKFTRNLTNSTVNIGQYHLYRVVSKTNNWRSYLNADLFYAPGTASTPAFPATPVIGRSRNDANNGYVYFSGNIAEVLIFSPPLTNSATNTVRDYLRNKYNLW